MTPEKQRIAIAEACGWKRHADGGWYHGDRHPLMRGGEDLPDYLNDLNAMHEAEKMLVKQQDVYEANLDAVSGHYSYRATAAQRAEAFLRTIGKWDETP